MGGVSHRGLVPPLRAPGAAAGAFPTPFPGSWGSGTPGTEPLPSLLASWSSADLGATQALGTSLSRKLYLHHLCLPHPQGMGAPCLHCSLPAADPLVPPIFRARGGKFILPFNQELWHEYLHNAVPCPGLTLDRAVNKTAGQPSPQSAYILT